MAERLPIPLANCLIDEENPRLPQPNAGQREALRAMASFQGRRIQALAKDIVDYGLNPSDLFIVMQLEGDQNRYVVLDGNRRLTAVRSLENPDLLTDLDDVGSSMLAEIRRLGRQYQSVPIDTLEAVVVKDRDEARHWMELRHTTQMGGAALVSWNSDDIARWRARTEGLPVQTQVLGFLERRGDLTTEERSKVPSTSLRRLLGTPEVRAKLGIEFQDGRLKALASEEKVAKALRYVAKDLESGKTKTEDIYTRNDRLNYVNNLPADVIVTPTLRSEEGVDISGEEPQAPPKRKKRRRPKAREGLIPSNCVLNVKDTRLRDIEGELRRLSLENHPNAVSVLFRVFLELSVDSYIGRIGLETHENAKLSTKLQDVAKDLVSRKKLSRKQAAPVRSAAQKDTFLAASVAVMNDYVHSPYMFPSPIDLRSGWDSIEPFVAAIWSP